MVLAWALLMAATGESHPAVCPSRAGIRAALGVEGPSWRVACAVGETGELQMAGFRPPTAEGAPAGVVAVVVENGVQRRVIRELDGPEGDEIESIGASEWAVSVGPQTIAGASWLGVEAIGRTSGDRAVAQAVVSFFAVQSDRLRHVWSGLGDRVETRLEACQLDTTARFRVRRNGDLERTRRTTRRFRDSGGVDAAALENVKAGCVPAPYERQTYKIPG